MTPTRSKFCGCGKLGFRIKCGEFVCHSCDDIEESVERRSVVGMKAMPGPGHGVKDYELARGERTPICGASLEVLERMLRAA